MMKTRFLPLLLLSCVCAFAQYPGQIFTPLVAKDNLQTSLAIAMAPGDTTAFVVSTTGWTANMLAYICNSTTVSAKCASTFEVMLVTSVSGSSALNVTRAYGGTSASAHVSGLLVSNATVAAYTNSAQTELQSIEKWSLPIANIRGFGAVCDGTDQNTAVQAALTAGARHILIPAGCKWVAPGNVTNAGAANDVIWYEGQGYTSIISSSNPATTDLQVGALTRYTNIALAAVSCTPSSHQCLVHDLSNADVLPHYFLSNGNMGSAFFTNSVGDFGAGLWCNSIASGVAGGSDCIFVDTTQCNGSGGECTGIRAWQGNTLGQGILVERRNTGTGMLLVTDAGAAASGADLAVFSSAKTGGNMIEVDHNTSTYTGTVFGASMANGSGAYTGNFMNLLVNGVSKFLIDAGGNTTTPAVQTAAHFTSTQSTGTAPLTIASTTPVANLNASPVGYNAAGTQQVNTHIVYGTCTLGSTCAVTFAGSAAWTGTNSYQCTGTDQTAAAAVKVVNTSASVATFTGTGTDVISYVCAGN